MIPLEFRKVHKQGNNNVDIFIIEYKYEDDEWYELSDFNSKVADIIVDALTKHQLQKTNELACEWTKNNDTEQS